MGRSGGRRDKRMKRKRGEKRFFQFKDKLATRKLREAKEKTRED